jgi:hypothetical protein
VNLEIVVSQDYLEMKGYLERRADKESLVWTVFVDRKVTWDLELDLD